MNTVLTADPVGTVQVAVRTMAAVYACTGVLFFIVALPLAMRRVPMNRLYGFRMRASLESPERWYELNEYGGRLMARWAWLVVAVGAAGWLVPAKRFLEYAGAAAVAVLLATMVPTALVMARARSGKGR
jgi:hypothetical protein